MKSSAAAIVIRVIFAVRVLDRVAAAITLRYAVRSETLPARRTIEHVFLTSAALDPRAAPKRAPQRLTIRNRRCADARCGCQIAVGEGSMAHARLHGCENQRFEPYRPSSLTPRKQHRLVTIAMPRIVRRGASRLRAAAVISRGLVACSATY